MRTPLKHVSGIFASAALMFVSQCSFVSTQKHDLRSEEETSPTTRIGYSNNESIQVVVSEQRSNYLALTGGTAAPAVAFSIFQNGNEDAFAKYPEDAFQVVQTADGVALQSEPLNQIGDLAIQMNDIEGVACQGERFRSDTQLERPKLIAVCGDSQWIVLATRVSFSKSNPSQQLGYYLTIADFRAATNTLESYVNRVNPTPGDILTTATAVFKSETYDLSCDVTLEESAGLTQVSLSNCEVPEDLQETLQIFRIKLVDTESGQTHESSTFPVTFLMTTPTSEGENPVNFELYVQFNGQYDDNGPAYTKVGTIEGSIYVATIDEPQAPTIESIYDSEGNLTGDSVDSENTCPLDNTVYISEPEVQASPASDPDPGYSPPPEPSPAISPEVWL